MDMMTTIATAETEAPDDEGNKKPARPPLPDGFRYMKGGAIEFLSPRKTEDGDEVWAWLCSPIEVIAETRGEDEKGWGLLLRVHSPDGVWHTAAMSRALFMSDGGEWLALLFNLGLRLTAARAGKERLRALLAMTSTPKRARTATRSGWYNANTFVLPDEAFGGYAGEHIVYQPLHPLPHAYRTRGTLSGWRREVAARAIGNSRLVFAISAAFAGPFLQPLNIEGGGFHIRGDSSKGKSVALWTAGSVWGGGPMKGFIRSWRTTDNGLESQAVQHSDTILLLDEMGEASGNVVAKTIYMLANGVGKQRAGIAGEGRPAAEFRTLFLSTGEVSLSVKMAEDGLAAMAGQETRFVDLVADAGANMGLFENIHDAASPAAFADSITATCGEHYGHAAREFLRRLLENPDEAFAEARCLMAAFVSRVCPKGSDGQIERAAKRFAIVAAAGEIASQWGILPWPDGTAMETVARMFREWLDRRGTGGSLEGAKAIAQVRSMIERHGASRFVPWCPGEMPPVPSMPVQNRMGFVRRNGEAATFYVMPEAFKREICKGLDPARVSRELVKIGAIAPDSNRKTSTVVRLPGIGSVRCIVIDAGKLFAD